MKTSLAIFLIAFCASGTRAGAQNLQNHASAASCPLAAAIGPLHLYGLWRTEFEGLPQGQGATLLFEKHAVLADSVSGGINRDGAKTLIVGDVDQGELTLEESLDGQRIAATWLGAVVDKSCGKEIRGTWTNALDKVSHLFVLRKLPGWQ